MLDLPTTAEKEIPTVSGKAWNIKFHKVANDAPNNAIEVMEPRRLFAELGPVDAGDVLANPQPCNSFTVLWIPQDGRLSTAIELEAKPGSSPVRWVTELRYVPVFGPCAFSGILAAR
jgi:hypothetical protein